MRSKFAGYNPQFRESSDLLAASGIPVAPQQQENTQMASKQVALTINGKRVTVDDSFLSLSPEQQNATVDEIAASIGAGGPTRLTGSPGKMTAPAGVSENIEMAQRQKAPVDLGTATAATISGFVNGIPVIGPLAQKATDNLMGLGSALTGGDYGKTVEGLQSRRAELARAAPIADVAGDIAGGMASLGGIGSMVGKEAIGIGGKFIPGLTKAAASNQALYTADQYARGNTGLDALGNGVPALLGAGGRVAGDAIDAAGRGVSNMVTKGAQRGMTAAATKAGPVASGEIKSAATQMFEASTGGKPPMISDNAYFRFLGGIRDVAANKLRINENLDQQSVGLLQMLMQMADDVSGGGVAVDMKDLHIIRQAAQAVAQSSKGRDAAFGSMVIEKLDDFINTLKPGDILGGSDPAQAANQLMQGISTWHRASKVGLLEEAIRTGSVAASGAENGIRNALRAIIKDKKAWRQFDTAEQRAIEDVVNGTGTSNLLKLIGKFGFGTGNASNMLGGTIGFGAGSMSPLGPLGGILAAGVGTAARKGSEAMTTSLARRALAAAGTPNLPIAKQAPNLLAPVARPVELMIRGSGV